MIAPTPRMSRKQELAIAALLREPTIEATAKAVGIAPITLLCWLQVPAFRDAYREARRQVVEGAIAHLQAATNEAVETLRKVMADDEAPASSRVSAAPIVLETAIRGVELLDLEERVERLEAALEPKGVNRWASQIAGFAGWRGSSHGAVRPAGIGSPGSSDGNGRRMRPMSSMLPGLPVSTRSRPWKS